MSLTEEDKKLLDELGLSDIPEEDKQAVLDTVDDRMSKRFVANLLIGLPEDKRGELEKKVEEMNGEDPQKIIETLIDLHPDAKKVLEDSAKEIVEELKKKPEANSEVRDESREEQKNSRSEGGDAIEKPKSNPATTPNTQIDQPEKKAEEPAEAPQAQAPASSPSISNDYYRP